MALISEAQRRVNVEQTLASWRLEGFTPDTAFADALERYVRGELSLAAFGAQLDSEVEYVRSDVRR